MYNSNNANGVQFSKHNRFIPDDLLREIFKYLPHSAQVKFRTACKEFNRIYRTQPRELFNLFRISPNLHNERQPLLLEEELQEIILKFKSKPGKKDAIELYKQHINKILKKMTRVEMKHNLSYQFNHIFENAGFTADGMYTEFHTELQALCDSLWRKYDQRSYNIENDWSTCRMFIILIGVAALMSAVVGSVSIAVPVGAVISACRASNTWCFLVGIWMTIQGLCLASCFFSIGCYYSGIVSLVGRESVRDCFFVSVKEMRAQMIKFMRLVTTYSNKKYKTMYALPNVAEIRSKYLINGDLHISLCRDLTLGKNMVINKYLRSQWAVALDLNAVIIPHGSYKSMSYLRYLVVCAEKGFSNCKYRYSTWKKTLVLFWETILKNRIRDDEAWLDCCEIKKGSVFVMNKWTYKEYKTSLLALAMEIGALNIVKIIVETFQPKNVMWNSRNYHILALAKELYNEYKYPKKELLYFKRFVKIDSSELQKYSKKKRVYGEILKYLKDFYQ